MMIFLCSQHFPCYFECHPLLFVAATKAWEAMAIAMTMWAGTKLECYVSTVSTVWTGPTRLNL